MKLTAAVLLFALQAFSAEPVRPNIILIYVDDLGWGDLSCQKPFVQLEESLRAKTPNIDRLAQEGVRFTQAYASGCVCAPSRAGLLTGRYQQHIGWYEFKEAEAGLPPSAPTLAQTLSQAGYANACIGKWHVGHDKDKKPLDKGFERFFGFLGGQHDYYDPRLGQPITGISNHFDAHIYDQGKTVSKINYLTTEFTDKALDFITAQSKQKKPFFLYLAYNTPHPPLQAALDKLKPYIARCKDKKVTSRDLVLAMIDSLDEEVGRVMARLKELGIDGNTLVVFSSDNGGHDDTWEGKSTRKKGANAESDLVQHNGGLRPRKGYFWEGGIRIPLILRWPGRINGNQLYTHPVTQLDLAATFADAAQVPSAQRPAYDGVSLLPYVTGEAKGVPHEALFWGFEKGNDRWAVRKGAWKLVREFDFPLDEKKKVLRLYHIGEDPLEKNDLAERHPEIVRDLQALRQGFYAKALPSLATPKILAAWQKKVKARKALHADDDRVRRDGAPGYGSWETDQLLHPAYEKWLREAEQAKK